MQIHRIAMGKPKNDEDQLATLLQGLAPRFDVTQNHIWELDRDSNRAV